ncbi:hypothetical protein H4R23_002294 [Coemansia sp. Cherry 401B]|nr:hypothetical protein H4R23_002294 [Coemansia sp. Cherry 401B]
MPVLSPGIGLQPRIDPDTRESILSQMFGIKVDNPGREDTVTLAVCGGIFGITAVMLVYAWCNYNYQPIRAKNLLWTTLIYLSTVLWFVGNIVANGHVHIVGAWSNCKLWIIWFRVLFCFVFASMTIVRFYALDRVFNQKKPFTTRSSLIAAAIVVVLNVAYCLVNQLLGKSLEIDYLASVEACNATQTFRNAALIFQWVLWAGCGVLIFRLRNIQSSFNEFRESILIFVVIVALLIESTVINVHFRRFPLQKARRIEKTVMDVVASTLVVWLFIGYPVLMSIFKRRSYELQWLERLAMDGPTNSYNLTPNRKSKQSYAKMEDSANGADSADHEYIADSTHLSAHKPFDNYHPLNIESVLNSNALNESSLPPVLRNKVHVHEPIMYSPSLFSPRYIEPPSPDGRRVI